MSAAVLVLAACGSDDDDTPPAASDGATEPVDISGTTLTVSNWDAYMPKSVIKFFSVNS